MDRAELEGAVQALLAERGRVLLALEGMSAAGKTTLAAELAQAYGGNVYHMDDFCFPAHQRPDDWRQAPGGHMDLERFRREVLEPLCRKEDLYKRQAPGCGRKTCAWSTSSGSVSYTHRDVYKRQDSRGAGA